MKSSLSFDQIREFSEKMKVEVPFTAVDTDDNVLLFLFMTDGVEKVNNLKNSSSIATEVHYVEEIDSFAIWIVPAEFVHDFSARIDIEKYAVCGLVQVSDKRAYQTLKDVVDYKATAQIYTFDKELKSISIKQIFTNDLAVSVLDRELKKR